MADSAHTTRRTVLKALPALGAATIFASVEDAEAEQGIPLLRASQKFDVDGYYIFTIRNDGPYRGMHARRLNHQYIGLSDEMDGDAEFVLSGKAFDYLCWGKAIPVS